MFVILEDFMNSLTDKDWGWWPVLFLRPPKNKEIDNKVLFKLSLFFGSFLGLIIILGLFKRTNGITWGSAVVSLFFGWIVFFLIYKFTFAYFWNRRARRLNNKL